MDEGDDEGFGKLDFGCWEGNGGMDGGRGTEERWDYRRPAKAMGGERAYWGGPREVGMDRET